MTLLLSLSLVLGLVSVPNLVAKAAVIESDTTNFQNFADINQWKVYLSEPNGGYLSALDGLAAKANGYKFTVYSNSSDEDCSISAANLNIGASLHWYLAAQISPFEPDMDNSKHIDKLIVSREDRSSFDLDSLILGAGNEGTMEVNLTVTGYKGDNPVPGAVISESVQSYTYLNGQYGTFDVSDNSAFNDIDSFVITPGEESVIDFGVYIQSITARKNSININTAPTATDVQIGRGNGGQLDGNYTYTDAETDAEGDSFYQWYRSDDTAGTNEIVISGANAIYYTPTEADYGKYLRFEVTPMDAVGLAGISVKSSYYGITPDDTSDDAELINLKETIEGFSDDDPASGDFSTEVNQEDRTITVTGDVVLAKKTLELNIPHGVKVIWKARLIGHNAYTADVLHLNGEGEFELAEEGELGVGSEWGVESEIYEFCAIKTGVDFPQITVSGGLITIHTGNAIQTTGQKTSVIITGGNLTTYDGATIYTNSSDNLVKVSGGFVSSTIGTAIKSGGKVLINEGIVRSMQGTAVDSQGDITVSGRGQVITYGGVGIKLLNPEAVFTISSGLVFAYTDDDEEDMGPSILYHDETTGIGSIVVWDKTDGKTAYNAGTSDDIKVLINHANAKWAKDGSVSGIMVDNGTDRYFVMIPVVTVLGGAATVDYITVKSAPAKTTYYAGEALNLSGLVVTLNKCDGTSEDVPFEQFADKGITTNPTNGRTLITESSVVIITYTETGKTVNQRLTIIPAAVNHTVTFNDGDLNPLTISVTNGSSVGSVIWPADPVKAGYTFSGWYTGENGSGTVFIPNTLVNADVTVYAKWTAVSNGGSGGNNNNSGNSTNNNSGTMTSAIEQITVDVKEGNTDSIASQITIERTSKDNGEKSDKVTYQNDKAAETVQKLKAEGKDTARIVIPDEKDEVSETSVNIPVEALTTLAGGKINLQIDTEEAKISLPKESVLSASQVLTDGLYFRLVPVKSEAEKETVSNQARLNAVLVSKNSNATATIIGNPITIETNMPSMATDITLPLSGVIIPTNAAEKEVLLKQLAVYIEHSDGDKELVQGKLVEYKEGVYGICFRINKFSTFTVVKTDAFIKSSATEITGITAPSNAVIKGSNITASVANEISSLTVKAAVSSNATWKLYLDKELKKEAVNSKLILSTGKNISYIKVTAQDGTAQTYKLTITRNKSSKADVTKVIIPEKAVIKGNTITAAVADDKTSLTVNTQVSSKASIKLYSDKALKKEIVNRKLSLKEGVNTIYLKVTAENGTSSKVYTLKITRKASEYKSHISLGLIGSKDYADKVAEIFKKDYASANVTVKAKGKYYLVTMNFKDKAAAVKACEEMISREYIINYYFD